MTSTRPRVGLQRPGGRTERVRRTVAEAVLSFIQERKLDFSYNDVAERSGVHKTTLYRRWPQRMDLINEALTEHNATLKIPRGGNWHETAALLVTSLAEFLSDPTEIAINCILFGDTSTHPPLLPSEYWSPVNEALKQVLMSAQQRDELPRQLDPQALLTMIMGPLLITTLMTREPIPQQQVDQLITILRALGQP